MIDFHKEYLQSTPVPAEIRARLARNVKIREFTNMYNYCRHMARIKNGIFFLSIYKSGRSPGEVSMIRRFLKKMVELGVIEKISIGSNYKEKCDTYRWIPSL